MINVDFLPNSIIDTLTNTQQVVSYADDIERINLPNHEDIDRELDNAKRDIDNYAKSIEQEAKEIKSNLSSMLDKDFTYKFELFVQLAAKGLIEESFPINDWLIEKQKLEETFSVSSFESLNSAIKNCEDEEIKNYLVSEYLSIIKECLNTPTSFKYMSGQSFIKELNRFVAENDKNNNDIYHYFKKPVYSKETGMGAICSQANFWQTYDAIKNIETSLNDSIIFLKQLPQNQIGAFVAFLSRTDFLFKKNYKYTIESFNKDNVRNIIGVLQDKEIRDNFLPPFLICLNEFKEKSPLKNEDKEMFAFVIKELDKAGQYWNLSNKLVKKEEKTKINKI